MNKYILFLVGCIGTRTGITILSNKLQKEYLVYLGYIALIPAIGFLYIYLNDLRKIGMEAQGIIWWNELRPIHGILYLLFAIYAIKGKKFAWKILAFDTVMGVVLWFIRYYTNLNLFIN